MKPVARKQHNCIRKRKKNDAISKFQVSKDGHADVNTVLLKSNANFKEKNILKHYY